MTLAPWRSPLAHALHRNRSLVYARYLQLATVRADGRPANRTVVFRGFRDDTNQLRFVTDDRSEKVEQLRDRPWGEACWYFPKTREQFRLSGPIQAIGVDASDESLVALRQRLWQELSDAARSQFGWPYPGKERAADTDFDVSPDPINPLPCFVVLLLDPHVVDHLELRGTPQNRTRYEQMEEAWKTQFVNP
ncbi:MULTISPECIES: Npun_F5749 family FMN-dependent PPOX-type flavoprotein [unclassified Leptolyngbya]|uniref:Npun_F5749 family FMN-dependent PPOX-type flavoprotein n=1 Tax=unclassified Leptolyngbya TaxID=2650499 RepID=UPI001682C483|nr:MULTISPECIES: Npun_F5749 family FMN-dependent PPOX-type flavoprotein [unclassified Leptolyngbya]MBD1912022.1 pyridoxamine 5'-phosphate oxidase family protein [Leptolyngbya sp. FACHB-8]MBD2155392.1 pyridoxamine 5'-phosphate oxidase family protein [Leptolyngbya sp. FACHB-16]